MTKSTMILLMLTSLFDTSFSQSKKEIDSLLSGVVGVENSKYIATSPPAIKIIAYGNKVLPFLVSYFQDTNRTYIKSDCLREFLNRGEVAIIIADRIELMPYATLTGIQNCLLEFCKDNSNWIEYYLWAIRRDGVEFFEQKYSDWLTSSNRKKWPPYQNRISPTTHH